jgi:hypothetical protein
MKESELKQYWARANEKLEMSLLINKINTEELKQLKVYHFISEMKAIKLFTLICGTLWTGFGIAILSRIFIYQYIYANKFFLFSATFQVALTAIAIIVYFYQIITIYTVDITEPVIKTQEKLSSLRSSTIWVARILFLQLPVWTTFYWNESMLENGSLLLWIIQTLVTLFFTFAALWLFFNIKIENRDKKWFRLIFEGKEWTPLMRAMELSEQIEEYKIEEKI